VEALALPIMTTAVLSHCLKGDRGMKKQVFALLAALAISAGAQAQVTVTAPWVRATVPQSKATGAFMQLRSEQDARLLEVRSDAAASVQIHQMEMAGQTMTMHAVDGLDLPAGKQVNLASGGYHVMLMDLKRQLKAGETVPLTLRVQRKGRPVEEIVVQAAVQPLTYIAPAAPAAH
jgi:copper(I)-binding protein